MDIINIFVGLDYHQSGVQVCILDQSGNVLSNRFLANSWKEIQIHVEHYGNCVQAAIESCSGAADIADELIQKAGGSVHLAHPGYVSRMKQGPDKTDYSDARLLADLVRVGYLPKVWLAPVEVREMRLLVRYRQQASQPTPCDQIANGRYCCVSSASAAARHGDGAGLGCHG